ncbi:hypothetical protein K2X89_01445 [Myxococcota bacterium]|nr:hypothetical protein [Myxococcota bacterium]
MLISAIRILAVSFSLIIAAEVARPADPGRTTNLEDLERELEQRRADEREKAANDARMRKKPDAEARSNASPAKTDPTVGPTVALPVQFPAEIPIFPGSRVIQGRGATIGRSTQFAAHFAANETVLAVHQFYVEQLVANGWTISSDAADAKAAEMKTKRNDCEASILITPSGAVSSDIFIAGSC